jgi:hypothetical protein
MIVQLEKNVEASDHIPDDEAGLQGSLAELVAASLRPGNKTADESDSGQDSPELEAHNLVGTSSVLKATPVALWRKIAVWMSLMMYASASSCSCARFRSYDAP